MDVITFPDNLLNTSGLSILLHGVISLPDARRDMIKILTRLFYNPYMHSVLVGHENSADLDQTP